MGNSVVTMWGRLVSRRSWRLAGRLPGSVPRIRRCLCNATVRARRSRVGDGRRPLVCARRICRHSGASCSSWPGGVGMVHVWLWTKMALFCGAGRCRPEKSSLQACNSSAPPDTFVGSSSDLLLILGIRLGTEPRARRPGCPAGSAVSLCSLCETRRSLRAPFVAERCAVSIPGIRAAFRTRHLCRKERSAARSACRW